VARVKASSLGDVVSPVHDVTRAAARSVFDDSLPGLRRHLTQNDSCVHLLNRTAGDSWRAVEELYVSGAIGSRECLQRQWDLIANRDEDELRRIVREVPLDPGFRPLIQALITAGAETVVLSDGYGFYAEEICRRENLTLMRITSTGKPGR
jgi:phosphoserine phosphatase